MRITIQELNRQMMGVLNDRYSDLAGLQEQLASGKRLLRPSDDPVGVANDLKLQTKIKEMTQFKSNINDSLGFMGVSETAMTSMNKIMQRIRELSVKASSDTMGADEREYTGKESNELFRQLIALVDTQYKGDYVFGGSQSKIPPLQINNSLASSASDYTNLKMAYFNAGGMPVGSTVQIFNGFDDSAITNIIPGSFKLNVAGTNYVENVDYQVDYETGNLTILSPTLALDVTPGGANYSVSQVSMQFDYIGKGKDIYGNPASNRGDIQREIESGITMPINISADDLTTNYKSGYDLVGTMIRFGQNLLRNNQNGIESAIDEIDSVFQNILSVQSTNGARVNRLETTLERNEGQTTQTEGLQSEIEDAEMADTITRFMMTQNAYNAALSSASKIIQPSLVNFL